MKGYEKLKPYFERLLRGEDVKLNIVASEVGISYGQTLKSLSVYILSLKSKREIVGVKAVFKLPDGRIETFGTDNKIIHELSGKFSAKLLKNVKAKASDETKWNGF